MATRFHRYPLSLVLDQDTSDELAPLLIRMSFNEPVMEAAPTNKLQRRKDNAQQKKERQGKKVPAKTKILKAPLP